MSHHDSRTSRAKRGERGASASRLMAEEVTDRRRVATSFLLKNI